MVAAEIDGAPARPKLRIVRPADFEEPARTSVLDPVTRDGIQRRVRDLARLYHLQWLIRQETLAHQGCIEALDDAQLFLLLEVIERARECIVEGIPFDDAGIVKSQPTLNVGD